MINRNRYDDSIYSNVIYDGRNIIDDNFHVSFFFSVNLFVYQTFVFILQFSLFICNNNKNNRNNNNNMILRYNVIDVNNNNLSNFDNNNNNNSKNNNIRISNPILPMYHSILLQWLLWLGI